MTIAAISAAAAAIRPNARDRRWHKGELRRPAPFRFARDYVIAQKPERLRKRQRSAAFELNRKNGETSSKYH
jgi:hypothetical protein